MISGKKCRLGKIILIRLIELGKNQVWLAHEANTSAERISAYVTGRAIPSAQSVYAISKVLEIDSNKLLEAIVSEEKEKVS